MNTTKEYAAMNTRRDDRNDAHIMWQLMQRKPGKTPADILRARPAFSFYRQARK